MLQIAPSPRSFMPGSTASIARSGARMSTSMIRSKRFIGSSRSPGNVIAALFTRMSTRPNFSTVVSTIAWISSSFARLVGTAIASPPASAIFATVSSIVPGSGSGFAAVARAAHATCAPAAASATAVAAPTPRLAPVTIATLSSSSMTPKLEVREVLLHGERRLVQVAELLDPLEHRRGFERMLDVIALGKRFDLGPCEWRRHRRTLADAQRVRAHGRLVAVVLAPVDEHAAGTLRLRHVDGHVLRIA